MTRSVPGYELLGRLGGRGAIEVFKARERASGRLCELNLLQLDGLPPGEREDRQLRFLDEGRAVLGFDHPGVMRVYDVGSGPGSAWIAQEHQPGLDLEEVLALNERPLSVQEVLSVGVQVGEVLGALGDPDDERVHRDVRPKNIIISVDGRARLTGFGLNLESSYERLHQGEMPDGGVDYLSPEQVEGDLPPTPRTDVYGLGATLYRCLTGRVPHGGSTLFTRLRAIAHDAPPDVRELSPDVPDPVACLLRRFMEWDADDRPLAQDVGPLLSQLAEQLGYTEGWEGRALGELFREVQGLSSGIGGAADGAITVRLRGTDRTSDHCLRSGEGFSVGRAQEAGLPLRYGWISRQHAEVVRTDDRIVLVDLGSANGTTHNDVKVEGSVDLSNGDLIAFGKSRFEVTIIPGDVAAGRRCTSCGQELSDDEEADDGGVCLRCQVRGDADREAAEHRVRLALEEARFEVEDRLPTSGALRRYLVRRRTRTFLATAVELGARTAKMMSDASGRALTIKHPGVLPAIDLQVRSGILIVVSEPMPGRTLQALVEDRGPLPPAETVSLGQLLCDVLDWIQGQALPALVRPETVHLGVDGQPRLLDVGLAPGLLNSIRNQAGWAPQPCYDAPEVEDVRELTPRAVVYSLGATLSFAVTGNPVAETRGGERYDHLPLTMVSQIPAELAQLLARCTSPDRRVRPSSPAELRDLLGKLIERRLEESGDGSLAEDEKTWMTRDTNPFDPNWGQG